MKTKVIFLIIALILGLCAYWLLNHSYVIVTFWLGMKAAAVAVLLLFLTFWLGRLVERFKKPKKSISDTYPPQSVESSHPNPDTNYTKKGIFDI